MNLINKEFNDNELKLFPSIEKFVLNTGHITFTRAFSNFEEFTSFINFLSRYGFSDFLISDFNGNTSNFQKNHSNYDKNFFKWIGKNRDFVFPREILVFLLNISLKNKGDRFLDPIVSKETGGITVKFVNILNFDNSCNFSINSANITTGHISFTNSFSNYNDVLNFVNWLTINGVEDVLLRNTNGEIYKNLGECVSKRDFILSTQAVAICLKKGFIVPGLSQEVLFERGNVLFRFKEIFSQSSTKKVA